jgi:hypothetical protein
MKFSYTLFLLFAIFVSCTKSSVDVQKPKDVGSLQQLQLPEWVVDPSIQGMISAVGIAPKTAGGIKMQIAQAEADAMANMAAQIQTSVSRVTKESLRRAGVATEGKNLEAVDSYFAQATKSLVKNVPISGAKRKNIFQSPIDGSLYIQMVIDQTLVQEYLVGTSGTLASGMKNFNMTQRTIAQTENAMKDLFSELDFSTNSEAKSNQQ